MKVIFEIDDDLVMSQVLQMSDKGDREQFKAYLNDHDEVTATEEIITEFGDKELSLAIALIAIGIVFKELDI